MVKKLSILLLLVIFLLTYKLFSSDGGMAEYAKLSKQIEQLEAKNRQQQDENQRLKQKVYALQHNPEAIETLARQKLGMIGENEVFIQVIEQPAVKMNQDLSQKPLHTKPSQQAHQPTKTSLHSSEEGK